MINKCLNDNRLSGLILILRKVKRDNNQILLRYFTPIMVKRIEGLSCGKRKLAPN